MIKVNKKLKDIEVLTGKIKFWFSHHDPNLEQDLNKLAKLINELKEELNN